MQDFHTERKKIIMNERDTLKLYINGEANCVLIYKFKYC